MRHLVACSFITWCLSAAPICAETFVVDDDGGVGVDFTDIQLAVDAASPGDTIIVRAGSYGAVTVEQGLSVVGESPDTVLLNEFTFTVRNLPAGQTASVAGFSAISVFVHDCDGDVTVDDVVAGSPSTFTTVRLYDNELVTLARCIARGKTGGSATQMFLYPEQRALDIVRSTVILTECEIVGGHGGSKYKSDGRAGMAALEARNATIFVQASLLRGGFGGPPWDLFEFPGEAGDGAPAMVLDRCTVELSGTVDDVIVGGRAYFGPSDGPGESASAIVGEDSDVLWSGVAFDVEVGVSVFDGVATPFTELVPAVPVLTVDGTGQLGSTTTLELAGLPNASVFLFVSPLADAVQVGTKHTQLLLSTSALFSLASGATDGTCSFALPLAIPPLSELTGLPVHVQAYVKATGTPAQLSSSVAWTLR